MSKKPSEKEQSQSEQDQSEKPPETKKSNLYVWKTPIRKRVLVRVPTEDLHGVYGIAQGKPGKTIEVVHGVYETADPDEIAFLESSKSFNGPNEDSFRRVTGREEAYCREIMAAACRRKEIVPRLKSVMSALTLTASMTTTEV